MSREEEIIDSYIKSEIFFKKQAYDWFSSSIPIILTAPISILGFVLNVVSIFVINRLKDNDRYAFKMIKIICFNSCLLLSTSLSTVYYNSPRYLGYKYDMFSIVSQCIISLYIATGVYWVETILDIVLSIERLSIFIKSFKFILKVNPYLIYLIACLIVFVLNIPSLLSNFIHTQSEYHALILNSMNYSEAIDRCKHPMPLRHPLVLVNLFLRDVFTLLIQVVSSLMVLAYIYQFLRKKSNLASTANRNIQVEAKEVKLSITTFCMALLSIMSHFTVLIIFITHFFTYSMGNLLAAIAIVSSAMKNSSNFFVLYFTNKIFKNEFLRLINRSK